MFGLWTLTIIEEHGAPSAGQRKHMTQTRLVRSLRRLALVAVVGVVGLLGFSLTGEPPHLSPAVAPAAAANSPAATDGSEYDLTSLQMFRQVVVYIKDYYVDPKRIDPREMFVSALEQIEKATPEVLVEGKAKDGQVKVTVGAASRTFEFKDVESIWIIPHRIRPVFAFIQENLVDAKNKRDIEYAAINGMLSTLDPHSWLLKPDVYREMKLQTRGEFGGLGFVISMDEERLTVKKVLKNTPASRAGIKKSDHIARIDNESTINMDLNEAVSKLRGKPGTEVNIYVKRGEEAEKHHVLTRDLISIESVTSASLADGVGYVRLASFAGTTSRDLSAAIRELKAKAGGKLNGLVLDMRSNPGGLLEQAIQVTDQFVEEGTIVTTAGLMENGRSGKETRNRAPKQARNDGGEREFPIAVLVNSESASASEIVAGALKNLNRAVIVGRQTFGKGSVQVLYDLPPEPGSEDEAALKLTIQQYLTPGDKSIQEIGVTPDIELVPAVVSAKKTDLFAPPRLVREADLDKHFGNAFAPAVEAKAAVEQAAKDKPSESLRYLHVTKNKDKDGKENEDPDAEELASEEPDEEQIASDYQVEFARSLVLRAPRTDRLSMLAAAKPFLQERRTEEEQRIGRAISELGLDWSATKKAAVAPTATVEFSVNPPRPKAGTIVTLTTTVTNTGKAPFERLRGYTRCDAEKTAYQASCQLFARREFLFGKVDPGQKKSWSTQVKVPNHYPGVYEVLTLVLEDAHGTAPEARKVAVEVLEAPRPAFGFTYQVLDTDGLAQPGETVNVQVDVRNTGSGRSSKKTYVSLRNSQNDKVFMKKGRVVLGEMKPGETKSATLTLEVKDGVDLASGGVPLKLEIGDRDTLEFTIGKVVLPSLASAPAVVPAGGVAKAERERVAVRGGPVASAPVVSELKQGTSAPVSAKVGDWLRITWGEGRQGFVPAHDVAYGAQGTAPAPKSAVLMDHEPPTIALNGVEPAKAPVVTDAESFKLSGLASDPAGLVDVRVFVDNEKVLFRSPKTEGQAAAGKAPKLGFDTEFPLKVGNNLVFIVAREDEEFSSQRSVVIHRRPPSLADRAPTTPAPSKTR